MPIAELVYWNDDGKSITFEYEFKWRKADFRPHRGLRTKIDRQSAAARLQIQIEVQEFILRGRDSMPVPTVPGPPDDPAYVTGRVLISVLAGLEGCGGSSHMAELAGDEAYNRVRSLLETPILEGYEPW